jgi:hypothetical protein
VGACVVQVLERSRSVSLEYIYQKTSNRIIAKSLNEEEDFYQSDFHFSLKKQVNRTCNEASTCVYFTINTTTQSYLPLTIIPNTSNCLYILCLRQETKQARKREKNVA